MATRMTTSWSGGIRRLAGQHRSLTLILVGGIVGAFLVAAGVMSVNAVLSWGVVAAMLLMHLGGHGMHGHAQDRPDGAERSDEPAHPDHPATADAAVIDRDTDAGHAAPGVGGADRHRSGGCH